MPYGEVQSLDTSVCGHYVLYVLTRTSYIIRLHAGHALMGSVLPRISDSSTVISQLIKLGDNTFYRNRFRQAYGYRRRS